MEYANSQIKVSKPELSRRFAEFLTDTSKRLQDATKTIQSLPHLVTAEKMFDEITDSLLNGIGAKHVTIYLLEEVTQDLVVKSSNWHPLNKRIASELVFKFETIKRHKVVNAFNVKQLEEYTPESDEIYGKVSPECILSIPILNGPSRVIGMIEAINKDGNASPYFTMDDESLMQTFSSVCSLISTARNVDVSVVTEDSDNPNAAFAASASLANETDLNTLVYQMMKKVQEMVKADRCAVFLIDEERRELWSSIAEGAPDIRIPISTGIAGYVAQRGEAVNIQDAYEDDRFNRSVDVKTGYRTRTILCIPMRNVNGKVIGVAQCINKLPSTQIFTKVLK
jgi:adenylate cyclase